MRQVTPPPPDAGGDFIPAAGRRGLTRFYDPVVRRSMREAEFKGRLVRQLGLRPGDRVLDLGCGTGTLLAMMATACPEAEMVGIDADAEVLARAGEKASRADVKVELRLATATALPFADGRFDHVVSSLLLHHLTREGKLAALREARRVLKPGGGFHLADFEEPANWLMRLAFLSVRLLDGFGPTADNVNGRLPELGRWAGFAGWTRTASYSTVFGTLSLFHATKPADAGEVVPC